MELQDKHVLLTGASGGIGREIAIVLATKGARLTLVARHQDKLDELKSVLSQPERHHVVVADLSSDIGLETLKKACLSQSEDGPRIDVVINNAGSNQFNFLAQRGVQSIESEMRLNLLVPILLSQSALSWISRPGIILNIGSTFGSIGFPGYTSYCAAKSGLQRFSEALDRELDGSGIRALYLAPRATDTSLNDPLVNQMNQQLGNRSDSPNVVAQHVVKILEKEQSARWIGWPEKLFARINQIFPSVVSSSIRKQQETIHHFINQVHGK